MRHQRKGFKLGRTKAHRDATLASLSTALIKHKAIRTTLTKAKALRMYVEPLITRSKTDTTHNRRQVFRHLQNKYAVTELFGEIAAQVGDRPGGYTRIVKLGQRAGDGAEMALIELVDYNDVKPEGSSSGRSRTRRGGGKGSRRRKKTTATAAAVETAPEPAEEDVQDASFVGGDASTPVTDVEEETPVLGDTADEGADTPVTMVSDEDAVTDDEDAPTALTDTSEEQDETDEDKNA